MSGHHKEYMLLLTFIELDIQITSLSHRLSANRYIELGDDPKLVQEIERALIHVYGRARSIEPYFDLNVTPLGKANIYFSLIKHVNETLKYLRDVRKKDYGSRQHTREFLEKLDNCMKSLYAIGDLVMVDTEKVH